MEGTAPQDHLNWHLARYKLVLLLLLSGVDTLQGHWLSQVDMKMVVKMILCEIHNQQLWLSNQQDAFESARPAVTQCCNKYL